MMDAPNSPMSPSQTANFKKLRWVVFGSCLVCLALLLWRAMTPGGQISNILHSASMSKMDDTGRASALALSVLAGLVFAWFASTNIAKILARHIK